MSFSLKNGQPIFRIKGGKMNGEKVYLDTKKAADDIGGSSNNFNEIIVQDGCIQQIPSYEERDTIYIAGPSGAGKSTYAAQYMKEYKKRYPNNQLVLFSPKVDDPQLNVLNPIQIRLCAENLIDPMTKINIDELQDSCVCFDDVEGINEKELRDAVQNLRNQILVLGRSKHISCITISHLITDNKNTKYPITESQSVVMFPCGGLNFQYQRFLKNYCGLSNNQIHKILRETPSRWVTIHKNFPYYILSKDMAYIL